MENMYRSSMALTPQTAPLVRGDIQGFRRTATSGTTATWSGGIARCESDTRNIRSAAGFTINNSVVGANGRSSTATAPGPSVAYYVFAIIDASGTVAGLIDTSATPTLPAGYVDFVLIDTCVCQAGGASFQAELSTGGGRVTRKQYPWGTYTVSATDAEVALSLPIPSGVGGSRVIAAEVALANTVAVASQASRTRTSAAGTIWYTMWAGQIDRVQTTMPVASNSIFLDAIDSGGVTFAGQMILMGLTLERGGSL